MGGGHWYCYRQFLVISLDAVPVTHSYGSQAVSLPLSFQPVSLLHSEPEGGMLSSSSPSLPFGGMGSAGPLLPTEGELEL